MANDQTLSKIYIQFIFEGDDKLAEAIRKEFKSKTTPRIN
jgi:hypothetical protein